MTSPPERCAGRSSGQASILLIGALLVALAFAGLAIDGARMFTARRDLQNVADSAALAGASAIDEATYRATGVVVLDTRAARLEAARIVVASGGATTTEIAVAADAVRVVLRRRVRTTFLRIVGRDEELIGASATASPAGG